MTDRKLARAGALGMGLGAIVLWLGSRATWLRVSYADDRTGGGTVNVSGAEWSTEVTAVVLLLLAATVAGLALRRWGRRIIGAVGAAAAMAVTAAPASVLVSTPGTERVKAILTYGGDAGAIGSTNGQAAVAEWAEITEVGVAAAGPAVAMLGALAAFVGGLLLALRPGTDPATASKYEKASQRRENIERDLAAEPDSGRVMWDALDADIDPTEK